MGVLLTELVNWLMYWVLPQITVGIGVVDHLDIRLAAGGCAV